MFVFAGNCLMRMKMAFTSTALLVHFVLIQLQFIIYGLQVYWQISLNWFSILLWGIFNHWEIELNNLLE